MKPTQNLNCQYNYLTIPILKQCQQPNCLECTVSSCTKCQNGYYINGNDCKKCSNEFCQECPLDNCTLCKNPMQLVGGQCICPTNTVLNNLDKSCQKCYDQNCDACIDSSLQGCTKCQNNLYLKVEDSNNSISCSNCNLDNYYKDETNKKCLKCTQNCKTCTGPTNQECTECVQLHTFDKNKNCIICPQDLFFSDGKNCKDCHSTCQKCNGDQEINCQLCKKTTYFLNGICQQCQTNNAFYIDGQNCFQCDKSCGQCTSKESDKCTSCVNGLYFKQKNTQKFCEPCDILNNNFIDSSKFCQSCSQDCKTCDGSQPTNCLTCKDGWYLYENKSCNNECLLNNGMYLENDGIKCSQCFNRCKQCNGKQSNQCLSCITGYYLKDDGTCDDCTNPLFYIDSSKTKCQKCHDSCASCKGSEQTDCKTCKTDLHLIDNICIKCVGKGLFLNSSLKCQKCSEQCEQCDEQGCSKCEVNYKVDEKTKKCVICEQQKSHFIDNNFCRKCNSACMDCFGPTENNCLTCAPKYYMDPSYQNNCSLCPSQQTEENFCSECEWQCNKCESSSKFCLVCKCIKCVDGYFNSNGKCMTDCSLFGSNYVENFQNRVCECKKGYIYEVVSMNNNQTTNYCSKIIPLGFFCNNQNKCSQCSQENICYECSSENQCAKCQDKYFLWEGKCTEECYPHLNVIPNEDNGICSCRDSYILIDKSENNNDISKCEPKLKITKFSIENILISYKEYESTNKKQQNYITITFNRKPTNKETQGLEFKIADYNLVKDRDYKINKMVFVNNILEIEVESEENYKIQKCAITINRQQQIIQFSETILVSKDYVQNKDQENVKQISSKLNYVSEALTASSSKHIQGLIDFLKMFQILCQISNFVQLLAPLTLIKDALPPQAGYGTILGASFVFTTIPAPKQLTFESDNLDKQDQNNQNKKQESEFDDLNSISNPKQQVLAAFGLEEYLYKNFVIVQLSISVISLIILLCLIARHFMFGKQYTMNIVDKLSNFLASYIQGSITVSLFSITLTIYDKYQKYIGIFQITCNIFFLVELFYLFKQRTPEYIQQNMPNFFQNINFLAKGSKSYLLISLLKKYLVITLLITMNNQPYTCAILIGVIFCLNGLYILYYRFFLFIILTVIKIIQEFMIASLFFIIAIAVKKKKEIMNKNILSNEDLNAIQNDGKIILIFILICLIISFTIFLFRITITIKGFINMIKENRDKKQKQQKLEIAFEFSNLDASNNIQKKYYSNNQINSIRSSRAIMLRKNVLYSERSSNLDKSVCSSEFN